MEIVAGLSLKNLQPRVWDPTSPYYLPNLQAIMVSYADFDRMPARRLKAMETGLRSYLDVPPGVSIYLDNGAFYFLSKGGEVPRQEYAAFVKATRPDWYAIPQDYIPTPRMSDAEQMECLRRTMEVNRAFQDDGYVPVVHISRHMDEYLDQLLADEQLCVKPNVALGAIVPNLLRAPKAMAYGDVLGHVRDARARLAGKQLHIFGIGGTATLHLAALLDVDSVDSSGWRNRAARGIVQLPGRGDRTVANLGNWRGREPDEDEWRALAACPCPACQRFGIEGLGASRLQGFCNRATHNLWTLLDEAQQIEGNLTDGTYEMWHGEHVDNSIYLSLIQEALKQRHRLGS
ncbi:MAG: hypothetical protein JXM73_24335 [Anaerolineae bacterium]|nr:hypothetical protein [Anaerolineae bacterium]